MDWIKDDGEKSDPKKWRTCARYGCRERFRRDRPWRERQGWGRYCGNRCRALDYWDQRREDVRRGSRMDPNANGHGRPNQTAQGRDHIDGGRE